MTTNPSENLLHQFIRAMPKVELHVHLQGSTRPETLLMLARSNGIPLPYDTVDGLRKWYTFTDFAHFGDIYDRICDCIQTPDDIELLMREFIAGQAAQNIRYTELTYTPPSRIPFADQLAAINRARERGEALHGVRVGIVIDIPREVDAERALWYADAAISGIGHGIVAFGLGGPEIDNPPERFVKAFNRARKAGLPSVPHAGETVGPESIWGALHALGAARIGHGVRCLEDPALVEELRMRQIPLEVCPTSNICLGVFDRFEDHPLPRLLAEGLYVTINSDDPPMFNTTLTNEYLRAAAAFGLDGKQIEALVCNGVRASFLPTEEKAALEHAFADEFARLRAKLGIA